MQYCFIVNFLQTHTDAFALLSDWQVYLGFCSACSVPLKADLSYHRLTKSNTNNGRSKRKA
jgi:hypothetical protein